MHSPVNLTVLKTGNTLFTCGINTADRFGDGARGGPSKSCPYQ
jgi:hypothetical protein